MVKQIKTLASPKKRKAIEQHGEIGQVRDGLCGQGNKRTNSMPTKEMDRKNIDRWLKGRETPVPKGGSAREDLHSYCKNEA